MAIWRIPIRVTYTGTGGPGLNIWHARTDDPSGSGAAQPIADTLHAFYTSLCAGGLAPIAGLSVYTMDPWVNVDDQSTAQLNFASITSGAATNKAPLATAICVTWKTSIAARRARGRSFLGPVNRDVVDADGTPTAGALTTIQNAAQTLVNTSRGITGGALGVYGLQNAAPKGTTDYTGLPRVLRDITAYSVRDTFAVLRSRRD